LSAQAVGAAVHAPSSLAHRLPSFIGQHVRQWIVEQLTGALVEAALLSLELRQLLLIVGGQHLARRGEGLHQSFAE